MPDNYKLCINLIIMGMRPSYCVTLLIMQIINVFGYISPLGNNSILDCFTLAIDIRQRLCCLLNNLFATDMLKLYTYIIDTLACPDNFFLLY